MLARLEAARQLYNACLGEALKRVGLVQQSKLWQKAWKTGDKELTRALIWEACLKYGFTDAALQHYAVKIRRSCWIGEHLDVHVAQEARHQGLLCRSKGAFRTDPQGTLQRQKPDGHRRGQEQQGGHPVAERLCGLEGPYPTGHYRPRRSGNSSCSFLPGQVRPPGEAKNKRPQPVLRATYLRGHTLPETQKRPRRRHCRHRRRALYYRPCQQ